MDLNNLDKQQLIELVGQILGHMKLSVPAPGRAEPGAGQWGSLEKEISKILLEANF